MKITKIKFIIIIITIFIFTGFIGTSVLAGTNTTTQSARGFIAPRVESEVNLNDGQVTAFWSEITTYQNISEFGEGGFVKFANNETHLFSLIVYPQSNAWVSIEFEPDPDACMTNLNDGWSFYVELNPDQVEARDIKFVGTVMPDNDAQMDLRVEGSFDSGHPLPGTEEQARGG